VQILIREVREEHKSRKLNLLDRMNRIGVAEGGRYTEGSLQSPRTAGLQIVRVGPKSVKDYCRTKKFKEHLGARRKADEPETSGAK
jgi:hypothetical protein